jgi:putative ABC transport system ATP-binding protein|tara:strand:+ start:430 stop:1116 length:687 start_codon:yes stop_codon:yes gene_type:complete
MTAIIQLKDVWKIYDLGEVKVTALQGLNLEIQKGEFVSIMGPSGSGKSTAVNMVGCLDLPTKGTITLNGKDISKLSESSLAQIRGKMIGFIFQQFNLIPTLTAKQNVMLPLMFQNIVEHKRITRAEELLTMVELGDRMDHKPTELSGGQQQRVAIARALAINPEVILADEPTGNLDSKTGLNVMKFLKDLHRKEGKTIVMVTHDDYVAKAADRTVHLKDGKLMSRQAK